MKIQVVLTENDPKLGKKGELIKVSPGFAQNCLFPQKKAKPATVGNLKSSEEQKQRESQQEARLLEEAHALAKRIQELAITVEVSAGGGEKLFGSVTNQDIQQELSAQGIALERKTIHLQEPIKKLGAYQVSVKIHPKVSAQLKLLVVKKE